MQSISPREAVTRVDNLADYTPDWPGLYSVALQKWDRTQCKEANSDPIKYLYPVMESRVEVFRRRLVGCGDRYRYSTTNPYRKDDEEHPYREIWFPLRWDMEIGRLIFPALGHFRKFDNPSSTSLTQSPHFQALETEFGQLLETARQLEQHVRDDLQLRVGQLSLQESRKSIEQSRISIQEGKRIKLGILSFS